LVMRERRVLRILSCMSTPCDMQMIAGIAERGDGAQGDEELEEADRNGDNFGICRCALRSP
jgi:hypothetical protein